MESRNVYFWRTLQGQEIDYIEESGGKISAFEFKYQKDKFRQPKAFVEAYKCEVKLVNRKNYSQFV